MLSPAPRLQTPPAPRSGFTLIELLIVMAIIAVMAALLFATIGSILARTSNGRTKDRIRKLQTELQNQWSAATETAQGQIVPSGARRMALFGDNDARFARSKVIWTKLQLRRQFPMTYEEALQPWDLGPNNTYVTQLELPPHPLYRAKVSQAMQRIQQRGIARNFEAENSALLLLILSINRRGNVKFNAEEALGADAIQDTNGDGLPEVVDGWGKPIVFFRWAGKHPDLLATCRPSTPQHLDCDTADPEGTLMNSQWNSVDPQSGANVFHDYVHPIRDANGAVPRSYYNEPAIVSYGLDGQSGLTGSGANGLFVEIDPRASGNEKDNVYSFRLQ